MGVANPPQPPEHTASDEQETSHEGGQDTGHPRARGRPEPGRDLPATQHHRPDLLPLEEAAGHDDQLGRPAHAHAREGQQGAQADGLPTSRWRSASSRSRSKNSKPAGPAGAHTCRPRPDVLLGATCLQDPQAAPEHRTLPSQASAGGPGGGACPPGRLQPPSAPRPRSWSTGS